MVAFGGEAGVALDNDNNSLNDAPDDVADDNRISHNKDADAEDAEGGDAGGQVHKN